MATESGPQYTSQQHLWGWAQPAQHKTKLNLFSCSCWRNYQAELSQNVLQYLQMCPPQEVVLERHVSISVLGIFCFLIKWWKVQFISIKWVIPSIAGCCCCCLGCCIAPRCRLNQGTSLTPLLSLRALPSHGRPASQCPCLGINGLN